MHRLSHPCMHQILPPKLWRPWVVLLAIVATAQGCGTSNGGTAGKPATPPDQTEKRGDASSGGSADPQQLLENMVSAYRQARSYQDSGEVRLTYRQQEQLLQDAAPLAVQYERPNRLRVKAYQLLLASDGDKLRAQIDDPASENLDHQFVVRPAPEKLSLQEMYTDAVLYNVISSGLGRHPIQLELLLAEQPLETFLDPAVNKRLLAPAELAGRECQRVVVEAAEGEFVFWIGNDDVLHRLEYPTSELEQQIAAVEKVDQLKLVATFHNARLNQPSDPDAFAMSVPDDAKQVQFFVVPPQPLPSELFGQQAGDFAFTRPEGAAVTRESLRGKIAALVWFNNNPASRLALEQLDAVANQFASSDQVAFFAVCTEPSSVSNDELQDLLQEWSINVPLVRDLEAHGRDLFQIPFAPTLVVLNAKGVVQIFEVGANPNLSRELPMVIERLVAGEDLAVTIRQQFAQERTAYEQNLELARGGQQSEVLTMPETKIAEKSEPSKLQLTSLWNNGELEAPGNILVVTAESGKQQYLVHDGWRSVAVLDQEGSVQQRHTLELPPQAAVSYLRTVVDGEGKRYYAASALLAPQLFLLDEQFKVLQSYPAASQPHDGIRDVQLADLDGDKTPEIYAGFWGPVGVQAIQFDGTMSWSNRSAANILSLAVTPANDVGWHKLLVSHDQGDLRRLNHFGHHDPPLKVEGRAIHQIFGAADLTGPNPYCGISFETEGHLLAVGLSKDFQELWTYKLPVGIFRSQLQFATSGTFAGQPHWVFAGPDGTIHFVGADGAFEDSYAYGRAITGIATARWADREVLLIATPEDVAAWQVERQ